jgi:molybdopterin converting factor small subunit
MAVKVVFMGSLTESTFTRSIQVDHCDDIHALHRYLEEQFPELQKQSFKILHNNEVLNKESRLEDGDEVVLLPPHDGI